MNKIISVLFLAFLLCVAIFISYPLWEGPRFKVGDIVCSDVEFSDDCVKIVAVGNNRYQYAWVFNNVQLSGVLHSARFWYIHSAYPEKR